MGITKKLIQNLRLTSDLLSQNLHFNEVLIDYTLKFRSSYLNIYLGIDSRAWEHSSWQSERTSLAGSHDRGRPEDSRKPIFLWLEFLVIDVSDLRTSSWCYTWNDVTVRFRTMSFSSNKEPRRLCLQNKGKTSEKWAKRKILLVVPASRRFYPPVFLCLLSFSGLQFLYSPSNWGYCWDRLSLLLPSWLLWIYH